LLSSSAALLSLVTLGSSLAFAIVLLSSFAVIAAHIRDSWGERTVSSFSNSFHCSDFRGNTNRARMRRETVLGGGDGQILVSGAWK
jgi:hypothetical protein